MNPRPLGSKKEPTKHRAKPRRSSKPPGTVGALLRFPPLPEIPSTSNAHFVPTNRKKSIHIITPPNYRTSPSSYSSPTARLFFGGVPRCADGQWLQSLPLDSVHMQQPLIPMKWQNGRTPPPAEVSWVAWTIGWKLKDPAGKPVPTGNMDGWMCPVFM